MKFFVNFLSAFRIAASFLLIPTMILMSSGDMHTAITWAWVSFILFLLGSISDWFDGYLARKYNVCTKIGGVMDHIGDKLLVVNTMIMLAISLAHPIIVVPIIIMIARELYISGLREFLGTQKIEMPVPKARFSMGKIKTTFQMISLSLFLFLLPLASILQPYFTPENAKQMLEILSSIQIAAIVTLWMALVASVWSATQYTMTFLGHLKKIK